MQTAYAAKMPVGCSQRDAVLTTCGARRSPTPQVLASKPVNQDGLPAEVQTLRSRQSGIWRVPLRDNHRKLLMRGGMLPALSRIARTTSRIACWPLVIE